MCALCQNKKFLNLRIKTEPVTDGAEAMVSVRLFIYIYEYRAQTPEIWIGPVHMLQTRQAWFLYQDSDYLWDRVSEAQNPGIQNIVQMILYLHLRFVAKQMMLQLVDILYVLNCQ